ncbi:MAG: hypothetical protein IH994_08820 [Proteobacteria bacterium]|nr:hypothetical protein [Pseudomonadota bacterium]
MRTAVLLLLLLIAAFPFPAHAYLDPGTSGMIINLIIGAIAGGLVTLKIYWAKVKAFINRSAGAGDSTGTDQ